MQQDHQGNLIKPRVSTLSWEFSFHWPHQKPQPLHWPDTHTSQLLALYCLMQPSEMRKLSCDKQDIHLVKKRKKRQSTPMTLCCWSHDICHWFWLQNQIWSELTDIWLWGESVSQIKSSIYYIQPPVYFFKCNCPDVVGGMRGEAEHCCCSQISFLPHFLINPTTPALKTDPWSVTRPAGRGTTEDIITLFFFITTVLVPTKPVALQYFLKI